MPHATRHFLAVSPFPPTHPRSLNRLLLGFALLLLLFGMDTPATPPLAQAETAAADVRVGHGACPNPVNFYDPLIFKIWIFNDGPDAAQNVTAGMSLVNGVEQVAVVGVETTQGSCSVGPGSGNANEDLWVQCALGNLGTNGVFEFGAEALVKLTVLPLTNDSGSLEYFSRASVSAANESNTDNNFATLRTKTLYSGGDDPGQCVDQNTAPLTGQVSVPGMDMPLVGVPVHLMRGDRAIHKAIAKAPNGRYTFYGAPLENGLTLSATLTSAETRPPFFQVVHAQPGQPAVEASRAVNLGGASPGVTVTVDLPFDATLTPAAGIPANRLDDLGVIYYHTHQASDLVRPLRPKLAYSLPVDIVGFANQVGPFLRGRAAARGDGLGGGSNTGFWTMLDSTGYVRIVDLSNSSTIAEFTLSNFNPAHFYKVEMTAQGNSIRAKVSGLVANRSEGDFQEVILAATISQPRADAATDGTVGISFGANPNRGLIGGQRADNLIVGEYRSLD